MEPWQLAFDACLCGHELEPRQDVRDSVECSKISLGDARIDSTDDLFCDVSKEGEKRGCSAQRRGRETANGEIRGHQHECVTCSAAD
jgi:hypothetical protein